MNTSKEFEKFARSQRVSSTSLDKIKRMYPMSFTPAIVEESSSNMAIMDVFSRLMQDRIIFLGTGIDDYVANVINAQLLFLEMTDSEKDIKMYINSGGGEIYSGSAILDVMDLVAPDVATICTGLAASMAAVILSHGTKGKRCSLKRSRVMIHQPLGGAHGQASDIEIDATEIKKLKIELATTLSENTGQTVKKILKDGDRDKWMTSDEALKYGMIDKIIGK